LQAQDAGQSIWGAYQATYPNGFVFSESKKLRTPVPLQLFSDEKAKQYGLVQESSGAGLIIVLVIVAAVVGYILYRRKKKNKSCNFLSVGRT
jgi:hypothetical protein